MKSPEQERRAKMTLDTTTFMKKPLESAKPGEKSKWGALLNVLPAAISGASDAGNAASAPLKAENSDADEARLKRLLLLAADEGDAKQVAALLGHGASARFSENPGGPDALCLAAESGHLECVKLLLPHSDATRVGEHGTALHFAAHGSGGSIADPENAAACVELLLERCDPKALDAQGETALMVAARGHSPRCVSLLIPVCGVDAIVGSGQIKGRNALMIAANHAHNERAKEIFDLLAEATADLNATDGEGDTALMIAVGATIKRDPSSPLAEPLIYASLLGQVDTSAKNSDGWTAMDRAAAVDDLRQVMALRPFTDLTSARDKAGRQELDGDGAFWSGSSIGVATNHDACRVADYLAPFSRREDADRAYVELGAEDMPQWAAFLKAEREAKAIQAIMDQSRAASAAATEPSHAAAEPSDKPQKRAPRAPRAL